MKRFAWPKSYSSPLHAEYATNDLESYAGVWGGTAETRANYRRLVEQALTDGKPVSIGGLQDLRLRPPTGYISQGNLWVFDRGVVGLEPVRRRNPVGHHVAIYGGKEVVIDYVKEPKREFQVAAQRVRDNLAPGGKGYVTTPAGKTFEISWESRLAKPVSAPRTNPAAKLRRGERQGDIFAAVQEPFALAGERAVDHARIASEKAAKAKAKADFESGNQLGFQINPKRSMKKSSLNYYVGISLKNDRRQVFGVNGKPTSATHGKHFSAVIGPFKNLRAALYVRDRGFNNPQIRCPADAERLCRVRSGPAYQRPAARRQNPSGGRYGAAYEKRSLKRIKRVARSNARRRLILQKQLSARGVKFADPGHGGGPRGFSGYTADLRELRRKNPAGESGGPSPTRPVKMGNLTVNIPVGSLDAPTESVKAIVNAMQNKSDWKYPTAHPFKTSNLEMAQDVAYGLDFYFGGHEMRREKDGSIVVTSKGYYHYITGGGKRTNPARRRNPAGAPDYATEWAAFNALNNRRAPRAQLLAFARGMQDRANRAAALRSLGIVSAAARQESKTRQRAIAQTTQAEMNRHFSMPRMNPARRRKRQLSPAQLRAGFGGKRRRNPVSVVKVVSVRTTSTGAGKVNGKTKCGCAGKASKKLARRGRRAAPRRRKNPAGGFARMGFFDYNVKTYDFGPGGSETTVATVKDYDDAREKAKAVWAQTGKRTAVFRGAAQYFTIQTSGHFVDRYKEPATTGRIIRTRRSNPARGGP